MDRLIFTLCLCVFGAKAAVAPFITPCASADSACMKTSAQAAVPILAAGIPELGVDRLDPMQVRRVKAKEAGLEMDFMNTQVKGLRNCLVLELKKVQIILAASEYGSARIACITPMKKGNSMHLELQCSVTLIGDYMLGGRLLVFPIEGKGKYKIKIRDIIVRIDFDVAEKQVDGETHWSIVSWKHDTDVKTSAEYHFQNLFNGNKQLSDAIHNFANSNWRDIYKEVAPPIVTAIVSGIVEETKKFFSKVPLRELVLD